MKQVLLQQWCDEGGSCCTRTHAVISCNVDERGETYWKSGGLKASTWRLPADLQRLHWCDTPAGGGTRLLSFFISHKTTARSTEITVSDKTTRNQRRGGDNSNEILKIRLYKDSKNNKHANINLPNSSLPPLNSTLFFFTFTEKKLSFCMTHPHFWRQVSAVLSALWRLWFLVCPVLFLLGSDWNVPLNLQSRRLCNCGKGNDSYRRVWTSHSQLQRARRELTRLNQVIIAMTGYVT